MGKFGYVCFDVMCNGSGFWCVMLGWIWCILIRIGGIINWRKYTFKKNVDKNVNECLESLDSFNIKIFWIVYVLFLYFMHSKKSVGMKLSINICWIEEKNVYKYYV